MSFAVRPAVPKDFDEITAIYNHCIDHSVASFRTERVAPAVLLDSYHSALDHGIPFVVAATHEGASILGYAYVSLYRASHAGYCHTVELSIYVHSEHLSGGVGSRLWDELVGVLRERLRLTESNGETNASPPIRHILSVMALDVEGHKGGYGLRDWYVNRGFVERGHSKAVGHKFGRWIDTIILQLTLSE